MDEEYSSETTKQHVYSCLQDMNARGSWLDAAIERGTMTAVSAGMRSTVLACSFAGLAALVSVAAVGCSSESPTPLTRSGTTPTPTPTGTSTTKNPNDDIPAPKPMDPAPAAGTEVGTETWSDGKQIPAAGVTIMAGATVTIDSGATVTVGTGGAITVKGSLVVKTGTSTAKLTGMNWTGIVVASGGTLTVDGLDISNAASGVWTQTGNLDATLLNSSIAGASTPFKMEPGSKLSVTKSKVTTPTGASAIAGTFTASYLDYDKVSNEGLQLNDPAGTMTISDSTLHGIGGGDYVVSNAGALVNVSYSTIVGAHCGFHFDAVDKFTIDHVSDDTNSYGAMLYGSGAGPNTITASNIRSTDKDLDFSGTNGATTISGSYTGGKNNLATNATVTNPASAPIANAKPR
jgi:hypothetical protein